MEQGMRVLVVDDCPDTAGVQALLLRLLGHEVRLANDGTEAVAVAQSYRPDVVLLDLILPGMDGFEVARSIRACPDLGRTTLIALTGSSRDNHRRQAAEAGFDHYLVKPVDPEHLEKLLATGDGEA